MSFAFKKFRFFSSAEVPGHAWPHHATCSAPNKACMACGCENGSIQLLDESFQPLASFAAHGYRVFEVIWLQLRNQQLLLSLGSEEPGYSTSTLKLWDVSRLLPQPANASAAAAGPTTSSAGADGPPGTAAAAATMQPVKAFKVFGPKTSEAEVTSMTAKEGLPAVGSSMSPPAASSASITSTDSSPAAAVVALGMANGMVYLYTLEAPPPAAPGSKGRPQPPVSHHQLPHLPPTKLNARPDPGEDAAVMGLVLLAAPSPLGVRLNLLFVVTESQTLSFNLASGTKTILDHQGVRTPHCCVLRSPTQQQSEQQTTIQGSSNANVEGADSLLMVARDEGLYEYTTDTRAGCTVFEGSKQLLLTLGRFVVVVTHEVSGDVGARSATVHVLDLKHRLVAGSLTTGSVEAAAAAWGGLAVVQGGGKITILKEVDLTVQLDALFRRSLHKLALDIARAHNADASTIAGIQQKWGDALYDKGEFDLAMAAYKETLHHLEPSYVLRRFLDAQRIHNLTSYLELLHEKGLASADHTTLLLNCYTKLKDVAKLDAFILRSGVPQAAAPRSAPSAPVSGLSPGSHPAGLKFDAETAVKVLRTAGYHRQALWVAEAAGQADWVLDILMEDLAAYDDALALLEKLPRAHRVFALKRMGQALVTSRPEATTKALMELCCPPAILDSSAQHTQDKGTNFTASVADFAHLYTRTPTALMLLCEFILNTTASTASPVADPQQTSLANEATLYHTLLELYLMEHLVDQDPIGDQQAPGAHSPSEPGQQLQQQQQQSPSQQLKQQPHSKQAQQQQQQQQQQQFSGSAKVALHDQQVRRGKALDLMASGWPPHLESPKYDAHHVLALCRLHTFQEGLVFLYDKMRLAREVLQVYMTSGDHAGLIAAVSKYGDACRGGDPQLWADVLQHFVEQPGSSCEPQIVEVVGHIEAGSILPPLVVLQLLAKNRSIKMSSVRQYVSRQLAREMSEAARDREAVTKLSSETQGLRTELHKLKSEAHVFQASRCSATSAPLELPALHFMCGHSFSARALGDGGQECPLCAPELRRVLEIRRNMAATGLQQDRFFTELRESGDGFSVIADHFGRGVMNITPATAASAVAAAGSKHSP